MRHRPTDRAELDYIFRNSAQYDGSVGSRELHVNYNAECCTPDSRCTLCICMKYMPSAASVCLCDFSGYLRQHAEAVFFGRTPASGNVHSIKIIVVTSALRISSRINQSIFV
jgi:hypothetical protein